MVFACTNGTIHTSLKFIGVLSLLLSSCGIALWVKSSYDVMLVSNMRQMLRLMILKQVDRDMEEILNKYVPGPKGNVGTIHIIEPEDENIPKFQNPIIFLIIIATTVVIHFLHCLLAIWLFIVLYTESYKGVRSWIYATWILVIPTFIGEIIQLTNVTFHALSIGTTSVLIIFYLISLYVASSYKTPNTESIEIETQNEVTPRVSKNVTRVPKKVFIEIGEMLL